MTHENGPSLTPAHPAGITDTGFLTKTPFKFALEILHADFGPLLIIFTVGERREKAAHCISGSKAITVRPMKMGQV